MKELASFKDWFFVMWGRLVTCGRLAIGPSSEASKATGRLPIGRRLTICPTWRMRWLFFVLLFLFVGVSGFAQELAQAPLPQPEEKKAAVEPVEPERWNLFYQATSIGQYHGTFHSPYSGLFSLQNYPERDVSLTTTLFFGLRLEQNTVLYFDPEIAGGRGFSNVNGLANFSNGELPRVASATVGREESRGAGRA